MNSSAVLPLDVAALERWATSNVPGFGGPLVANRLKGGQSNPTYLVETPTSRYVLRRKPRSKLLKSAHAVDREYRVLCALAQVGYPAPRPVAFCEDETVIGSVFYLMEHVAGRVFQDPTLPGMSAAERAFTYDEMNRRVADLHAVDVTKIGLADYGRPGNYFARQVERWTEQYRQSQTDVIPEMHVVSRWLAARVPRDDGRVSLVHGDWRIANISFVEDRPEVAAVLDWELSTLGHPHSDLAYQCMHWLLPHEGFRGLKGVDRASLGIPSNYEYVSAYCRRAGLDGISDWTFLIVFSLFRYASIGQGLYRRFLDRNVSDPERARKSLKMVAFIARLAAETIEDRFYASAPL
jgi:aminoglycoside phosphotransferase (APT) family kinase protein